MRTPNPTRLISHCGGVGQYSSRQDKTRQKGRWETSSFVTKIAVKFELLELKIEENCHIFLKMHFQAWIMSHFSLHLNCMEILWTAGARKGEKAGSRRAAHPRAPIHGLIMFSSTVELNSVIVTSNFPTHQFLWISYSSSKNSPQHSVSPPPLLLILIWIVLQSGYIFKNYIAALF